MDERDFRGADHVDDKCLRPERFHEPARVKNDQQGQERQANCAGMSRRRRRRPGRTEAKSRRGIAYTILLCVVFCLENSK